MKIVKIVLIVVVAIIAIPLIAALFMKKDYHVERSITINAPQSRVHEEVSDLRKVNTWSPFLEQEPSAQVTYDGPDGQVGSSSSWKGEKSGSGTQTITAISPDQVKLRVDFREPFEGTSTADYILKTDGAGTTVTWSMDGTEKYPLNIMVPMMDGMLGQSFDRGLQLLKAKVEGTPAPALAK